jgi:hypothetical protein
VALPRSDGEIAVEPGSQEAAVVAALTEALDDSDPAVRRQAQWALEMIQLKKGNLPRRRTAQPRPAPTPLKAYGESKEPSEADASDEDEEPQLR